MTFAKLLSVFTLLMGISQECFSQTIPHPAEISAFESQLHRQAAMIADLQQRLDAQAQTFHASLDLESCEDCLPRAMQKVPLVSEVPAEIACDSPTAPTTTRTLDFYADYDEGFVIRPFDPQQNPFELKVSGWIQLRHHGFARNVDTWTDNAGVTRPVRNRNAFDIERGRFVFSGYAVDERMTYFLHLDGDTDGGHAVDFFDYWWAWKFSDLLQVQVGKRKAPGIRQWLLGARRTRFVDRPMANEFFRPDRTVGLFAVGKIGDHAHYEAMVGNGYFSSNTPNSSSDDKLTFAATNYFDPFGDFGGQIVDFACSAEPLVRFGHSFIYSPQTSDNTGAPLDEADFIRLSDGTRLAELSALAPGVTVLGFDVLLYGVDAAIKWHGFSMNSEVFFQWIENIQGDGVLPVDSLFRSGFYVEGGYFLIAKTLDVNVRYSQVSGEYGDASEYAAGVNWYPLAKPQLKISFDVTALDGSPVQNTTTDTLAGDDGVLFRTQFQAEF